MKKVLVVLGCLFFCSNVFSATMISDADPTGAADKCVYQDGTSAPVETAVSVVAPALTGRCNVNLDGMTAGVHNLQVWFKSTVWGVESAKVPFGFTKPAAGGTGPQNLRIVP